MATRIEIEKMLKRQVENLAQNTIDQVGDEIARGAKANFNSARWEVPADDPSVIVYNLSSFRWKNDKWYKTIICQGNQVLFIEFGAGVLHGEETSTVYLEGEKKTEHAPRREIGVKELGTYGKQRGKGDSWYYNSDTGREARHTHLVRQNRAGKFVMRTGGIRPIRALWRAMKVALKKLESGRLNLK